ncbi:hypothetical protein DIPPA_26056 [Diplonema papillatum]|nr:hypothetical protein DIPPA_26056 [Diplonema papillatum]
MPEAAADGAVGLGTTTLVGGGANSSETAGRNRAGSAGSTCDGIPPSGCARRSAVASFRWASASL